MNKKQIQISVCKALLDCNSRCCGDFINKNDFAVTVDGIAAYVFSASECVFDIAKIRKVAFTNFLAENENDKEMKQTNEFFVVDNRVIEKYVTETAEIYARADVTKQFKGFRFFASDCKSRIIVKDDFGRLVGMFMPYKYNKAGE